jgi:hypothetical protein
MTFFGTLKQASAWPLGSMAEKPPDATENPWTEERGESHGSDPEPEEEHACYLDTTEGHHKKTKHCTSRDDDTRGRQRLLHIERATCQPMCIGAHTAGSSSQSGGSVESTVLPRCRVVASIWTIWNCCLQSSIGVAQPILGVAFLGAEPRPPSLLQWPEPAAPWPAAAPPPRVAPGGD